MNRPGDRAVGLARSVLRIVAGLLFLFHGTQKVFGVPPGVTPPLASLLGAAGAIECVAGVLIILGLFARPAAFIAAGEMAFAYFIAHAQRSPWPTLNQGEPAILNCFIFLYVAAAGPGWLSVDAWRRQSRR
jgi:putative oxidoreductase